MAEIEICPNCGVTVLDNTGFCEKCCITPTPDMFKSENVKDGNNDINEEECSLDISNNIEDESYDDSDMCCEEVLEETLCLNCGTPGEPGTECIQCGAEIPCCDTAPSPQECIPDFASLVLPGGCQLRLVDGKEYAIGRESDIEEIKNALFGHKNVSRTHCTLRLDLMNRRVFIRDLNSTNGTFTGKDNVRVVNEQSLSLPALIFLGHDPDMRVRLNINI